MPCKEYENEIIRLRNENANLKMDLHQARAEWHEEKRRNLENDSTKILIELFDALADYNTKAIGYHEEHFRTILNEKIDAADKYLASLRST